MIEGGVQYLGTLSSSEFYYFSSFLIKISRDYPAISTDVNTLEVTEWHPGPSSSLKIQSQKLAATEFGCGGLGSTSAIQILVLAPSRLYLSGHTNA